MLPKCTPPLNSFLSFFQGAAGSRKKWNTFGMRVYIVIENAPVRIVKEVHLNAHFTSKHTLQAITPLSHPPQKLSFCWVHLSVQVANKLYVRSCTERVPDSRRARYENHCCRVLNRTSSLCLRVKMVKRTVIMVCPTSEHI